MYINSLRSHFFDIFYQTRVVLIPLYKTKTKKKKKNSISFLSILFYVRYIPLDSTSTDRDHHHNARAISVQTIGTQGTSTGITNAVRKNATTNNDQICSTIESAPILTKIDAIKTTDNKLEDDSIVQQQTKISLDESQFYARTSTSPYSKRHDFNDDNSKELSSSTFTFFTSL